jgi:DNA-binding response OmpR family regulator
VRGCRVAIIEDEFIIAQYAKDTLEDAGALVLGPYANSDRALRSFDNGSPDCVILDLNVGKGINFEPARALRTLGVPFAFLTGYDRSLVPKEFQDIEIIQKPMMPKHLIGVVERMCARGPSA